MDFRTERGHLISTVQIGAGQLRCTGSLMKLYDRLPCFIGCLEADALPDDGLAQCEMVRFPFYVCLHFGNALLAPLVGIVDEDMREQMDAGDVFGFLKDFLEHLETVDFRS